MSKQVSLWSVNGNASVAHTRRKHSWLTTWTQKILLFRTSAKRTPIRKSSAVCDLSENAFGMLPAGPQKKSELDLQTVPAQRRNSVACRSCLGASGGFCMLPIVMLDVVAFFIVSHSR